jgi:hypothetical protein
LQNPVVKELEREILGIIGLTKEELIKQISC